MSFKSQTYHDFFIHRVPAGPSVLQYAEDHNWDTTTTTDVINSLKGFPNKVQQSVSNVFGRGQRGGDGGASEAIQDPGEAIRIARERISRTGERLKTRVQKTETAIQEKGRTAAAVASHQAAQFSEGVEELVRKAEEALKHKFTESTPEDTAASSQPPHEPVERDVYDKPLPIGFEPPPGYSRPRPSPKDTTPEPAAETPLAPAPIILPLIAPAVSELGASEPIIAQLASTIDNLASFLSSNPSAAEKAADVLDIAKIDLTALAARVEQVKEEERLKLEQTLDEQAREYTVRLLDLEMAAQDKLDNQEDEFRKLFDEEKMKFVKSYREKLNDELKTQTELINER